MRCAIEIEDGFLMLHIYTENSFEEISLQLFSSQMAKSLGNNCNSVFMFHEGEPIKSLSTYFDPVKDDIDG